MKKLYYLVIVALAVLMPAAVWAWKVPNETLHYALHYKWGFINANAGVCQLSTYNIPNTNRFRATLTGKSVDLLGHYYAAGDTIQGEMLSDSVRSVYTQHLSHEAGDFIIETMTYDSVGPSPEGEVVKHLPNGQVLRERTSNYGGGVTLDLLSVFYYIRQIEYGMLKPGDKVTVNVLTHKTKEKLTVTYNGFSNVEVKGESKAAFSINLVFGNDNNPSQTDNMDVWISTDDQRIPYLVQGNMKIGHIVATYLSSDTLDIPIIETDSLNLPAVRVSKKGDEKKCQTDSCKPCPCPADSCRANKCIPQCNAKCSKKCNAKSKPECKRVECSKGKS